MEKIMLDQAPRAIELLAGPYTQLSKPCPALIRQLIANSCAAALGTNRGGQGWAALFAQENA
jgi:hypothetical protein